MIKRNLLEIVVRSLSNTCNNMINKTYQSVSCILLVVCSAHEQAPVSQCLQKEQDEIPNSLATSTEVDAWLAAMIQKYL